MSRTSTAAAAAGGLLAGAAAAIALTGRSRPAVPGLGEVVPPAGLPPARVLALPGRGEQFVRDQPGPAPDAPAVVLLHGWLVPADLNWFTSYGPVGQVARVIAMDHRGHGRGTRPSHPFRLVDVADDVAALLRELGTGPAVLVGYSMGGPIAQLVWQRHPDVVAGLVLGATAAQWRFGPLGGAHWRLMGIYQVALRLLPRAWLERTLLAQVEGRAPVRLIRTIGPEVADFRPLLPWAVGEIERGSAEDIAEAGRELGRYDARGWLGGVDVPHAVLVTTRDRLVPPSSQLELVRTLPDPLVVEVDGDHDAPGGVAGPFTDALLEAIRWVLDAGADAGR